MKHIRLFLVLILAGVTVWAVRPQPAYALPDMLQVWWPEIFGKKEEGPDPADTLQAPFGKPGQSLRNPGAAMEIPYEATKKGIATGPLEKPHRSEKQVAAWLSLSLSEILTLEPTGYAQHVDMLTARMTKDALGQFKIFMEESKILETLKDNNLRLHGYVEETPFLLADKPAGGRYHWLFEVPVVLTFLPVATTSYKKTDPINQRVTVKIHVGRVTRAKSGDELIIESWQVRKTTKVK